MKSAKVEFMNYLDQFAKGGGTVILATNIVAEVHHVADWLIFLEGGRPKLLSPTEEVSTQFQRIRKPRERNHPVFEDPECEAIGLAEDDSVSYLIPVSRMGCTLSGG